MLQKILEKFNIPQKCVSARVVPKVAFYEEAGLTSHDKKKIKKDINKVRWLYVFKPETINIKPYHDAELDYREVSFIQVDLDGFDILDKIINIIQRSIQYPVVLFLTLDHLLVINVADKRRNQADSTKLTVEKYISTPVINLEQLSEVKNKFFEALKIKNLSQKNLLDFYMDIRKSVISLKASKYTQKYVIKTKDESIKVLEALEQIEEFEVDIEKLKSKIKKEKQINRQTDINIRIKDLNRNIENLKKTL